MKIQIEKKIIFLLIIIFTTFLLFSDKTEKDYEKQRENMVKSQIKYRGIKDKAILNAMRTVPRHLFVPKSHRSKSYYDRPLPIGYGQTISQPYIVALMTELLCLIDSSKVLEIGTGSGYQAAVLAEITDEVYTIEIVEKLHKISNKTLRNTGYSKVKTKSGDGYFGWEEHAPYDAIIVTCAAEFVPPPLIKQLNIGGVMCIPVGPPFQVQNLLLITKKSEDDIITEVITYVRFVPLLRD
ncbi:MAG: protein-L-isoaspartate(D-aspartate) O-methyltransferase [Candidatus Cloacimonetes bacterium]|nr:protein-L-isoaspartate(D-aspartate) O-methyltransferase [Candidatus Cloacimonadota bacterium]